ncbi:subtilisin-like protein [Mycena sp. CBHHK59/15]|nr:subtilisin-like protein [Mycena sp. CBHHK59/15]
MLCLLSLALIAAAAAQTLSPSVQHAKRTRLPAGWARARRHAPDAVLPLRFGLTQPNADMASLEALLNDVSHPDSPNYGAHWSPARVAQHFAPKDETVHAVVSWLTESGVSRERVRVSKTKGWVMLNASVAETEALLNTEYHVFLHEASGAEHVARRGTVSPVLTGAVHTILDELSACDVQITPACLRALYEFVYTPVAAHRNSLGIVEYTPQAYVPADLDMFARNFSSIGPSLVGARPVLSAVDGGVVQTIEEGFGVNGESNLDLEYAMNLVTAHQPVSLYQVGDLEMGASFNNLLDALDGTFCSFEGGDDPVNDGIYPDPIPGGYQGNGGLCLTPSGDQSPIGRIFNPSFPSTCPFVTAVGATQVNPGAKVTDPESACMQVIFSGGGFSNYFAVPDYQKGAVNEYLQKNPPPYGADVYNSTGGSRAYPDISANGANYVIAVDGEFGLVFGTSASSPVVGAILTMVNDARLALGKGPIGFINPTIYSPAFRGAFHDITTGTNPGCGTSGFAAAAGFDPVTGLGTPNFPKLLLGWLLLK